MSEITVSGHYGEDYYRKQSAAASLLAQSEADKFRRSVRAEDIVVDFGCGGGHLLAALRGKAKIGIEPNLAAAEDVMSNGARHFASTASCIEAMGEEAVDVIISNHALEHAHNPLAELRQLLRLLKKGGTIHFVVPCESRRMRYRPNDFNNHLFTWSPLNLGNLFNEAGFDVIDARPIMFRWPPRSETIIRRLGWTAFNLAARVYAHLDWRISQVEVVARRSL